jgi:hypothetical protein
MAVKTKKLFVNLEYLKKGIMDIQTRKIEFVQEFLKLQNEELIARLESLLRSSTSKNSDLKPMTIEELNIRIDRSISDSEKDRLTSSADLINEIEKWV